MSTAAPSSVLPAAPRSRLGEPAWEIARLFPSQGAWTEADYLALNSENWMVELSDGCLEVLPMPNAMHQRIVGYLFGLLKAFVLARNLGEVFFAPMPVRLGATKFREPDIMFFRPGRIVDPRKQPDGVDLAMEVVSESHDGRERDMRVKPVDYAAARIPEYWIVDPELQQITVLRLEGDSYTAHGVFGAGGRATSALLLGFEVEVAAVFAAGLQA